MRARTAHAIGLHRRRGGPRYRWVVLGAGAFGAAAFAALRMGLPALGPAMRDAFDLTLGQVGLALASVSLGAFVGLIPWGMLTDRIGERPVLAGGLAGTTFALIAAALAPSFAALFAALSVAGLFGSAAMGASGRAVVGWFARAERGFALGIRQMALPLGGALASLTLPWLAGSEGLDAALLALAGLAASGALAGLILIREPPVSPAPAGFEAPAPLRDPRIWRLGVGGAMLIVAQAALLGFLVLFLVDERGISVGVAGLALAAVQVLGALGRLVAGRRSDRAERRVAPMRAIAVAATALIAATAALTGAPGAVLYPVLLAGGVVAMSWNGLAVTAAAEISGRARAATAMSVSTAIVSAGGAAAPALFGALVQATSYRAGFAALALAPLLGWLVLGPLEGDEENRARARTARLRRSASLQGPSRPRTKEAT